MADVGGAGGGDGSSGAGESDGAATSRLIDIVERYRREKPAEAFVSAAGVDETTGASPKQILAILVLCIDDFPHEDIWRRWVRKMPVESGGVEWEVRFFVHAKHPNRVTSRWLRSKLIPVSFAPEWGSIELVRAMMALIEHALKEEPMAQRFALVSESCLPVVTLQAAVDQLQADPRSWMSLKVPGAHGRSDLARVKAIRKGVIPARYICKGSQWFLLNRRDAELICDVPAALGKDTIGAFAKVQAADEFYVPTLLAMLGRADLTAELEAKNRELKAETTGTAVVGGNLTRKQRLAKLLAAKKAAAAGVQGTDKSSSIASVVTPVREDAVARRHVTFAEWKFYWELHPTTFTKLEPGLVQQARKMRVLFARRFPAESCDLECWKAVIADDSDPAPAATKRVRETGSGDEDKACGKRVRQDD